MTKRNQVVAAHSHENAHISPVYYLEMPEHAGGLRLLMNSAPNEIAPNLFSAAVADIAVMLKANSECEKFMLAFSLWKKL